jgi:hypothetical protein
MAAERHNTPAGVWPAPAVSALLLGSYSRIVGQPLASSALDDAQASRWLYEDAPFCVPAHNAQPDLIFIYVNRATQRCFEYSWAEFVTLPSRLSAEVPNRAKRQMLLNQVTQNGFAKNYTGLRISGSGRRFSIENATVWQLLDHQGLLRGQGAMLPHWRDLVANRGEAQ